MALRVLLTANTSWYLHNFRASTLRALVEAGYEVYCVAPLDAASVRLRELGVQFIPLELDNAGTNPLSEFRTLITAVRLLKRIQPDFVFNFTIKMNSYFGLAARWAGTPYANNVSGLGTAFIHQSLVYKSARHLYGAGNKGAQKVFFQNSEDRELFISAGLVNADATVLLPGSGVNVKRFPPSAMPAVGREQGGVFTFLMISRLIGDKGVREYVEAARIVRETKPHTRFALVGPSGISNKSAIADKEIERWQAEGVVELAGEQADVVPWLKACHVLVLPSYREGMPRTVLEAASVGRPAIVSDVPGCRQAIANNETGWLCKVKDPQSLAETMIHVISEAEKDPGWLESFGQRASERVQREFSDRIVIDAYLKCLEGRGGGQGR